MVILFQNKKLQKCCSDEKALIKQFGSVQAKKIMQRLAELVAADNLAVICALPAARAHELKGNLKGKISLDLKHPYRLLLEPDLENHPIKKDGGLDWNKVTIIKILGVEDTHV